MRSVTEPTSDYSNLAKTLEESFGQHPVRRFLAFRILELMPGRCEMEVDFKPEFDNTTGAVHGGILSMLADTAAACALATVFGGEMNFVTSNLNIHFLRRTSSAVRARANVVKKGARISVVSAELFDDSGRLVSTALCDFVQLEPRNTPES